MKKLICILCSMMLVISLSASAQEPLVDEFFRCQAGRISFALPGYPQIVSEEDLPARELEGTYCAWQNKLQLMGAGAMGGEFQVHIADLTPSIEWMREDRPGEEEAQYRYNALMNTVSFYLAIHSGNVTDDVSVSRIPTEDDFIAEITFGYTYPDAPGVEYRGRGFLDGNLAVIMMVHADEANLAALNDMQPLSAEKAAVFHQAAPETVTVGRLQFTFPEAPLTTLDNGYWLYEAFTPDFGYVSVEHMEADLSFMMANGMDADTLLRTLADNTAKSMQAEGIIDDYEIRQLAEGMYAFSALEIDHRWPEGHEPLGINVLAVFTLDGVYTISAVDTEMGRAAFDTLTVVTEE